MHGARLHSLLYLTLPETVEGLWLFGHQDYMHLAWRVRVQMLSPRKVWQIGAGLTTAAAHLTNLRNVTGDVLLNGKDLDPHNKQHWPGVLKMFSPAVAAALKARIDGPSQETQLKGTYAVIVVFQRYLESWLKDRNGDPNPVDAVKDAAFVLAFLLHWRYYVSDRFDLKINFLTRETCLDLITSCHGCILRFVQFRECWGGQFRPDGSRFSSRFSEYMFQYGRMAQTIRKSDLRRRASPSETWPARRKLSSAQVTCIRRHCWKTCAQRDEHEGTHRDRIRSQVHSSQRRTQLASNLLLVAMIANGNHGACSRIGTHVQTYT